MSGKGVGDAAALLPNERPEFGLVVGAADGLTRATSHLQATLGHRTDGAVAHTGEGSEVVDGVPVLDALCGRAVQAGRAVVPPCAVGDGVERQACDPFDGVFVHLLDAVSRVTVRPDPPGGVGEHRPVQVDQTELERRLLGSTFTFTAVYRVGVRVTAGGVAGGVGVVVVAGVGSSFRGGVNCGAESSGSAAGVGPVVGDAGVAGNQCHVVEGREDERG